MMNNKLIIDRFEGDWAIIEYGDKTIHLPKELLPKTAREGDIIDLYITIKES